MKKISLILLIPFGSLIGISILFNVYNDYLKMAASQYNYDYLYICGSLTLAHGQNSQMSFMYGFFFVKFLFFTVVCVVIMI